MGQISGNPGGLQYGAAVLPRPLHLLGNIDDGGLHGWLLNRGIPRYLGGDSGGTAVPNHFQRGGGRSGAPLDLTGGGGQERPIRVG